MKDWTDLENKAIAQYAKSLTSTEMSKSVLKDRTPKAIRHQAEKLGISLTAHVKYKKAAVTLALELREAGFYREAIQQTTGVPPSAQRYYELARLN